MMHSMTAMNRCVAGIALLSVLLAAGCRGEADAPARRADGGSATKAVTPTPSPSRTVNNERLIAQTWREYKEAAFFGDGNDAAELLVSGTRIYFDEIRHMAYSAGPRAIERRSVVDRILIGSLRMRFSFDRLRKMDVGGVLNFTMEENLATGSDRGALNKLEISKIRVDDDDGRAVILLRMKEKPKKRPLGIDLFREGNEWKIDLMPILRGTSSGLVSLAREEGLTVDEMIDVILEFQLGEEVPPDLWDEPE